MGKLNLIPTEGYILLEKIQKENKTSGYLTVTDQRVEPQKGLVVAVGADTVYPNTDVEREAPAKVGDTVIYSSYGSEIFTVDQIEYVMCPFDKILGVYGNK